MSHKPLIGLAAIAAQCGRSDLAAQLLGAVDHLLHVGESRIFLFDLPAYEYANATARPTLGEPAFAIAYQAGGNLPQKSLLAVADLIVLAADEFARQEASRHSDTTCSLTPRELEVLRLVANGMTDREIAESLFLSRRTVNAHVASILRRLEVSTRQDAVERGRVLGIVAAGTPAPRYT